MCRPKGFAFWWPSWSTPSLGNFPGDWCSGRFANSWLIWWLVTSGMWERGFFAFVVAFVSLFSFGHLMLWNKRPYSLLNQTKPKSNVSHHSAGWLVSTTNSSAPRSMNWVFSTLWLGCPWKSEKAWITYMSIIFSSLYVCPGACLWFFTPGSCQFNQIFFFYEPVDFKSERPYQTSLKLGLELTSIASTLFYGWNEVKELLQIQEDRKYTLVSGVPCVHIGKGGTDGVAFRSVYISLVSFRLLKSSNL